MFDLLRRFLFGHDGGRSAQLHIVKGLVFPSALDVKVLPIIEDRLLLPVR